MKRFFFSMVALTLTTSMIAASGGGSKGTSGSGSGSGTSGTKVTSGTGSGSGSVIKSGDTGTKTHVLDKHVGDVSKTLTTSKSTVLSTKFELHGNKTIAKLPGFKSDPKLHTTMMSKYKVPSKLHDFCFFHHDFCYSTYCWFPSYGCCGYWHPYCRCWYYWYEPYCCYLPYSYVEVYRPVVVTEVAAATNVNVNVNNNNNNTNDNIEPQGPTGLPPGASATLPAGVNPIIPAPKQ
jgi:hypothetical protein